MQRTYLFGAVDALIEEILGPSSGAASTPIALDTWALPTEGRPKHVIADFGAVAVTARRLNLSMVEDFAWIGGGPDAGHVVELYFHVGGAPIAQVECMVLSLYLLDLLDFADASDMMGAWLSRVASADGELSPRAAAVWPQVHGYLPERTCWIKSLSVAPIFQSTALLSHILATVKWAAHSLDPTVADQWVLSAEAPTPEQAEYETDAQWSRETHSSLLWYRAALQELGAVQGGPIDHGFGDGDGPHYCTRHADLFLLPQLRHATASVQSTGTA